MRITIDQCKPTSTTILSAALGKYSRIRYAPTAGWCQWSQLPNPCQGPWHRRKKPCKQQRLVVPSQSKRPIHSKIMWSLVLSTDKKWVVDCLPILVDCSEQAYVNWHTPSLMLNYNTLVSHSVSDANWLVVCIYYANKNIHTADHIQYHPLVFDFWDLLINSHSPDH